MEVLVIVLVVIGYGITSIKLINQGNEALVERMGTFHRKLGAGLKFIIPFVDQIVMEDTTRQQILDIPPQKVLTKDNVYLEIDGVIYWRIVDMYKSYYKIDNLKQGLDNITTTTIREIIAQSSFEDTNASRADMDKVMLDQMNATTLEWGVEILRVDIQHITPPESVQRSMEEQRAAEIRSRALVTEAEGERQAAIKKAEGTMTSMQIISDALRSNPDSKEILRYLVAQDYVNASYKLGASSNAKVVFVDPGSSNNITEQILGEVSTDENENNKKPERE
jgi:regulator of protease activity HflC (stomatin/prohibitin superfamily)